MATFRIPVMKPGFVTCTGNTFDEAVEYVDTHKSIFKPILSEDISGFEIDNAYIEKMSNTEKEPI